MNPGLAANKNDTIILYTLLPASYFSDVVI